MPDILAVAKLLRTLLIVLLAALFLVLRATPAAMLFPQGSQGELTVSSTGNDHEATGLAPLEHDMEEAGAADYCDEHGGSAPQAGGCDLCASCRSMTSLGTMPKVLEPLAAAVVSFPSLSAPAATPQFDGQGSCVRRMGGLIANLEMPARTRSSKSRT